MPKGTSLVEDLFHDERVVLRFLCAFHKVDTNDHSQVRPLVDLIKKVGIF